MEYCTAHAGPDTKILVTGFSFRQSLDIQFYVLNKAGYNVTG